MTDKTDSEKRKESDSDEPQYTVDLNGKRYSLNEAARASIERRASLEYEQNEDSWIEWNVQARADQPQLSRGNNKDNSHDHWESLLNYHDCSVVGELGLSQEPGANSNSNSDSKKTDNSNSVEDMGPYSGKGGNWHI